MTDEFPYDVFLSHSTKDKGVVREVAQRLRKDGVKVWFDEWVLKPGDSIPAKIEEGLERSRVLVLCMSANAFGSDWAQLEAGTSGFATPPKQGAPLHPLCGLMKPPLKALWRNSFRSTGSRKTASRSIRGSRKDVAMLQAGLWLT